MHKRFLFSAAVVLAACGTSAGAPLTDVMADVASPDDSTGSDATVDSGSDVQPDTVIQDTVASDTPETSADVPLDSADSSAMDAGVNCSGKGAYSFQNLQFAYKDCTTDKECFAAFHQIDCCGTQVAYGLNKAASGIFQSLESQCEGQYPKCGCPPAATQAEDGFSSINSSDFLAGCIAGKCHTLVKLGTPACSGAVLQAPTPFKWCGNDTDCDFSSHQTDCCGTQVFTGIAKVAKAAYDSAEKVCSGSALCNCMAKATTLDDGQPLTTNAVAVQCVSGVCLTGKW